MFRWSELFDGVALGLYGGKGTISSSVIHKLYVHFVCVTCLHQHMYLPSFDGRIITFFGEHCDTVHTTYKIENNKLALTGVMIPVGVSMFICVHYYYPNSLESSLFCLLLFLLFVHAANQHYIYGHPVFHQYVCVFWSS